jgi:hypothetical protein
VSSSAISTTLSNLGEWFSPTDGYVSTGQLASTTTYLLNRPVSFDTASNVIINSASTVTFNNVNNLYFRSTFVTSSLGLIGNSGTEFNTQISTINNMIFSTATFNLSSVSSFISTTSKITMEYNPMLLFAKLAAPATTPAVLSISTFLQYGATVLGPMTTNFMYVIPSVFDYNGVAKGTSTMFQQPIRFEVPLGIMGTRLTSNYSFLHMIPDGWNSNTSLADSNVTAFFCKSGSSANITVFNSA